MRTHRMIFGHRIRPDYQLTPKEAAVVRLWNMKDSTASTIAKELALTRTEVSRILVMVMRNAPEHLDYQIPKVWEEK